MARRVPRADCGVSILFAQPPYAQGILVVSMSLLVKASANCRSQLMVMLELLVIVALYGKAEGRAMSVWPWRANPLA